MKKYLHFNAAEKITRDGVENYPLLTEHHGCVNGCCTGISVYNALDYPMANIHEDQEGFFVFEGEGWAKIGEEEIPLSPGVSFIVPAGFSHTVKRNPDSLAVKVFWFHAAI